MSDHDAQITERVIFRVNPALHTAINDLAESANRSINGEICTAVDKWLYQRDSLVLMKDRLLSSASEKTIEEIRRSTPAYLITQDAVPDTLKTTVRFKDSVSEDLRDAWLRHKEQSGHVSMNTYLKIVVAWWLTYSFQLAECAKAIHQDFMNSIRPSRGGNTVNLSTYGCLAIT
ncbi:hypothetical protein ACI77O_12795 [Pseudomonas tritici]|uniref:hypothetical protein n=1 Tax=Pseudomonas tritici TaxID=2745518 RepID=UPI00387A9172